jgi:chromosomal replication initiation ATPase DnaA
VESLGAEAASETEKVLATTTKSVLANIAEQARETINQEVSEFLIQALHNRLDQLGSALKQTGANAGSRRQEEPSETEVEADSKLNSLSFEAGGIVPSADKEPN